MWKISIYLVSLMAASYSGGYLPDAYGKEAQVPETKVLEGYMVSNSGHLASFDRKHAMPVFENDVGRLYAVTKLEKPSRETHINYLWFLWDRLVFESILPVKENQLTAKSALNLKPKWVGRWRVDVTSADGTLLYSIPFIVHRKPDTIQTGSVTSMTPNEDLTPPAVSSSTYSVSATIP